MPQYLFKNPDSGETKEVFQKMNEKHEYFDESGKKWQRVFTVPQASVDKLENMNPFSESDWMNKTTSKKGMTVGDAWDLSTELSKKRGKILGKDPQLESKLKEHKQKYKREYIRQNGGNTNDSKV